MVWLHLYLGVVFFFAMLVLAGEHPVGERHYYWRGLALAVLWPALFSLFLLLMAIIAFAPTRQRSST